MKKVLESRIKILSAVILAVFLLFTIKLVQYQIIEGEKHFESSNTSVVFEQTLTASRGDIVDAYGTPLASSQLVFNVTINRAYLQSGQLNQRIIEALEILEENDEDINDILPMEKESPYSFIKEKENEINWVRKTLELNVYATENDVLEKLAERYSLEDIPREMWRKVGGIRYTMEREGYSLSMPFTIATDVSEKTVAVITENARQLSGIEIYDTSKRYYEDGTILPHLLGTVGVIWAEEYEELKNEGYGMTDTLGKSGLEKLYESYLKGTDGSVQIERNMYGEITDKHIIDPPKEGDTVKLTIDYQLQEELNKILAHQIEVLHQNPSKEWGRDAEGISAVVIDVKTGGILAIANYPSYDLNLYSSNYNEYAADKTNPLFNRAVQGLYRPGSVFKCAVALAALQDGVIDEDYRYTCSGVYTYYAPSYMPSCANGKAHGTINVKEALKVSCNCFFFEVGRQLGIDRLNEIANSMGMGIKTGLEVSERTGVVSNPEYTESLGGTWHVGNVIQAAIGQMDTALTTVQLATYAATLANEGERLNTHIVDSIVSIDGEVVYKTPVNVLSELPDKNDSYRIVEEGMLMASTEGSASRFLDGLPFGVASKTGTAQVANGYYNATMMAYGPVDNPEIAIGIIAEKSGNGYMLAESVRDVFLKYYELKDVRQNENWREILHQRELEAQQAAENPEHTENTAPQQDVQQPQQTVSQ
ncbi:MAG: hypothetical protein IKT63_06500 [Oscillospiraceae bacterium]|nr:hypothetical protein [Oscillospiraceae bacterium]